METTAEPVIGQERQGKKARPSGSRSAVPCSGGPSAPGPGRRSQWLRAAAGLRYVKVDFFVGEPDAGLCGSASKYEHAASTTISQFMTEQTRLHYTWNAAERLLAAIRLPPVKDNRSA